MQLPQIISETDQLSYTVRILEGIGRVIALGEVLLRYLFNFDIARLRDLVADGYLRAHRNIVEQPFCMLYRESDTSGGSCGAELVVLGGLQCVWIVVFGTEWKRISEVMWEQYCPQVGPISSCQYSLSLIVNVPAGVVHPARAVEQTNALTAVLPRYTTTKH